jgi:hypothetical protein
MIHAARTSIFNMAIPFADYTPRSADVVAAVQTVVKHAPADDREVILSALGLTPYTRAVNPNARDKVMHTAPNPETECLRGHARIDHAYKDKHGHWVCRTCKRESEARRKLRVRNAS